MADGRVANSRSGCDERQRLEQLRLSGAHEFAPSSAQSHVGSDVVGQVYNGGVTQFFANYDDVLEMAQGALDDLAWPELSERYRLAASEYIHIEGTAVTVAEWRRYRANEHERMRSAARDVIKKAGKEYVGDEDMLLHHYLDFVQRGLIEELSWDYPCCDAFNKWFWSAACKADSIQYIGDYISNNRAELCLVA